LEESLSRPYRLEKELSRLFDLESKIDTVLSVSLYYLNQFMDSERSSIFLFQHGNQKLTIFSSLDLEKNEIQIPKSCGVASWVFENRKPAVVNNAYEDSRFYKEVDDITGFLTRNLICTPLLDDKDNCLGTLQSLNKKTGGFTTDDLELLNLAAHMVAVAIAKADVILKS
jgi:adenylate cyclase